MLIVLVSSCPAERLRLLLKHHTIGFSCWDDVCLRYGQFHRASLYYSVPTRVVVVVTRYSAVIRFAWWHANSYPNLKPQKIDSRMETRTSRRLDRKAKRRYLSVRLRSFFISYLVYLRYQPLFHILGHCCCFIGTEGLLYDCGFNMILNKEKEQDGEGFRWSGPKETDWIKQDLPFGWNFGSSLGTYSL